MAHSDLIDHLLGASSAEIGRKSPTSKSAEEVDKTIARELDRLERKALKKILDAAQSGDLESIAWLEHRGLVAFGEYTTAG